MTETPLKLYLYNTLSRKVELFTPTNELDVKMYSCGPTVYDFAHIGNLRTFLFQDLLKRVLAKCGFSVTHCMNITDVEDKIIRESQLNLSDEATNDRRHEAMKVHTEKYASCFFADLESLKILPANHYPRATEYVDEMISLISKLQQKKLAYEQEGSVYFKIANDPKYGRLSNINSKVQSDPLYASLEETDDEHLQDFALWKSAKPGEPYWPSPWGNGRPGWHIECSAMGMKVLGKSIDLHTGGIDLIFPHHENEIAQSEGCLDHAWVHHWAHGEFLMVDGKKMSKSLGNFYTLNDLKNKQVSPIHFRFAVQSNHYRKPYNFSMDGIRAVRSSLDRIHNFQRRMQQAEPTGQWDESVEPLKRVQRARQEFWSALCDDLNTPEALAAIYTMITDLNALDDRIPLTQTERQEALSFLGESNGIFEAWPTHPLQMDEKIEDMIEARNMAKKNKNWSQADAIRQDLSLLGITIEDKRDGSVTWYRH